MAAIETFELRKHFENLIVVDRLDLAIDREIFGLLRPNGSGKTATVRMLTKLFAPTEGDATICGHSVIDNPLAVWEQISYVPQDMAVDTPVALKASICRDIVSIWADGYLSDKLPEGVAFLGMTDSELRFEVDRGDEAGFALSHALTNAGMTVRSVSVRQPTLDDAFLALVGESDDMEALMRRMFYYMERDFRRWLPGGPMSCSH